jgi:hypothetical protein
MALDRNDRVRLWASRHKEWACLVIDGSDRAYYEIRMDRAHVEALRDYLPGVLAGLDRWAADDQACEHAEITGERTTDLAAQALDQAVAAEAAGAHGLATSLRAAVAEATERANAVDAAVRTFGDAAADADDAAEGLIYAMREAENALRRLRDDDRPAELVEQ